MPDNLNDDRPRSQEDYICWYNVEFDESLDSGQPEQWYNQVTRSGHQILEESEFWKQLLGTLGHWDEEFRSDHNNFALLAHELPEEIGVKEFDSAVNKSFRLNVVTNKKWPAPPEPPPYTAAEVGGDNPKDVRLWYGPHNWLTEFSDIFRIRLVASYFDGVRQLAEKAKELAERTTPLSPELHLIAQQDGYHAAHLLVRHELTIDDFRTREFVSAPVHLEIQITTDIQVKIITLLHNVYKNWRVHGTPSGWQWDYGSNAFAINYLGSTLHYLEGMMVRARDENGGIANAG